jgi:hypothetical protein
MLKRQKELVRRQRQQEKTDRRKAARESGTEPGGEVGTGTLEGEDPDIAGIVPGPQAPEPEWLERRRREQEEKPRPE